MKLRAFLFLFIVPHCLLAQLNTQKIKGTVLDKLSQAPLVGAVVQLVGNTGKIGTQTDNNGRYVLDSVALGRCEIMVTYSGYKDADIPNIVVTSGKEVIVDVQLEERFTRLKEVVVKSGNKAGSINKLATVSTRTFSMEEVNRYAGGRSDPARLVANFAGVSAPDDSRNDIVIRGNSPIGVLWRIDGMDVTNPNHFATVGTTGGAVSALNTNMLKNSDFFTSAFPSDYGNAIAGVFDLGFRNGNTEKREHSLQMAFVTGLEAMTEGPIKKGNSSSYVVAYRQSVAELASILGINIGTAATPAYRDLSFKVNSGNTPLGSFSLFGILANSSISVGGAKSGTLYASPDITDLGSAIGIVGLKHIKNINSKSYVSTSFGINYSNNTQLQSGTDSNQNTYSNDDQQVTKTAYEFIMAYNLKVNSRTFLKFGIQDEILNLDLYYRTRKNLPEWKQIWENNSSTHLAQAFGHLKYNINEKVTANVGLHAQKLFLNSTSFSVEPRIGLRFEASPKSSFTAGFGLHSQMQPFNIYFNQSENLKETNKDLGFTRSQHYVLGYDWQPKRDWRVKVEVYYQYLNNVPVDSFSSSYSMLNSGSGFKPDLSTNLKNEGTGTNYGAELTLEKFFSKGYYALLTGSVYEAKYTGSDGIERNTAFNGKYVYNLLMGKEFRVGYGRRNKFSADLKVTNAGGRHYTPIDIQASRMLGNTIYKGDDYAYSSRYENYFRLDFKLGYVHNNKKKKVSQSFSIDLQNLTNHQNEFSKTFDNGTGNITTTYQLGLFPNFIYKVNF